MKGKSKCKILKEIRRQIAAENDIEYVTSECKYQGDCSGTCPKCEAEVRYLEAELEKRRRAGKAIAVAGIAAALTVNLPGCALQEPAIDGDVAPSYSESTQPETTNTVYVTQGVIVEPPETTESIPVPGEVPLETDPSEDETTESTEEILMGDIPLPPTEEGELMGEPAW